MAAPYAATRVPGNVIELHLSPNYPVAPLPGELREDYTPQIWEDRLRTLTATTARYNKVWFERIWMLVAICAMFVVPVALFPVIVKALHLRDDITASHIVEARAISFALFVGIVLLFFVPLFVWKFMGQKQANALLAKWDRADRAAAGSMPLSNWSVKSPGVFRSSAILRIQVPATKATSFSFDAYLPSYIGAPNDPDANYYYPYKPGAPGLPRMSVIGNVPLFNDEKRAHYGSEKV